MASTNKRFWLILLSLILLITFTRFNHFGTAFALPDATLATFFLAGLYLSRTPSWSWMVVPLLLLAAILTDLYAVTFGGISDWCITPAYWGLLPTYAVMWLAGRWCAPRLEPRASSLIRTLVIAVIGSTLAFAISNLTFFWFSGRYEAMTLGEYTLRIADYFVPYVSISLLYVAGAMALHLMQTFIVRNARSVHAR